MSVPGGPRSNEQEKTRHWSGAPPAEDRSIAIILTQPGHDGGDQGEDGDDFGETDIPGPAGEHRFDFRLDALDPLALALRDQVQAVDQARDAAQALHQVADAALDGGARAEMVAHPDLDQRPRQLPDVD